MPVYFYILIFITAAISIYTDITQRKIKNLHLLWINIAAILLYIICLSAEMLKPSLLLILNPLAGLLIGFSLYAANLWKAGDAKLDLQGAAMASDCAAIRPPTARIAIAGIAATTANSQFSAFQSVPVFAVSLYF